jgi:ubiquinone/menaquinone biosynthesis C-methylase UbiE
MADGRKAFDAEQGTHVCPWQAVRSFDNFLRPYIHNPDKILGPYLSPGMTVADIGCGRGFATLAMARLVGESGSVWAADLQPEMLAMTRERVEAAGLVQRVQFHTCESNRIGLSAKLDFALAFWMAHEVPDLPAFLGEIQALLKPGGRFLMVEPRVHVGGTRFEEEVATAQAAGLAPIARPHVRISRAALFEKG